MVNRVVVCRKGAAECCVIVDGTVVTTFSGPLAEQHAEARRLEYQGYLVTLEEEEKASPSKTAETHKPSL